MTPGEDAPLPDAAAPPPVVPRGAMWVGGAVAALAAAAVLFLALSPQIAVSPPVPAYSLDIRAGDHEQQLSAPSPGAASATTAQATARLAPGARLELVARPAQPVTGIIDVKTWRLVDGALEDWQIAPRLDATGEVRVEGTREALFGATTGRQEVVIGIGWPELVADEAAVLYALNNPGPLPPGVQLLRIELPLD